MGSPAIGMLERVADRAIGLSDVLAPPAQTALDAQLRGQRLRVVWWYSIGIGVFGIAWCVAFLGIIATEPAARWTQLAVVTHAVVLSGAGWLAYYYCRAGHLRHATYTDAAALTMAGTANLAFIANAEGAAVITFAVAVSLVALVVESREWLWWGAILSGSALIGTLVHTNPIIPLFVLPPALAAASLLIAAPLGLAVPIGLFALFSRNLTASREEAWALARAAADANRLATERATQLEQRTGQLQAKHAELNDFLYVVSHDLRAPLINLAGFSGSLQDSLNGLDALVAPDAAERWEQLHKEVDESLEFIVRSVRQMEFLVQGLLELSRIDSRPVVPERVDLGVIVRELVDTLQYRINARGIAVRVDPLPSLTVDRLRITQLFGNLLDNAVKYMKPEGDAAIYVGCRWRNEAAQFFVRDNGVGIRPEDHVKIFRLFGRVGDRAVPGDGVGLAAVKKIVEKLGGGIWVESSLGRGSTFWFTLSALDAAQDVEVARGAAASADQDSPG